MKLAAVVLTYNRKDLLVKCLDGILQQSQPVDTLFIIDNGSTDRTMETLQDQGYLARELLHYVRMEQNIGAAGGFSAGLKYASEQGFDWVWIMDDDVIPRPDALERLLQHTHNEAIGGLVSYQTGWKEKGPRYRLPKSIGEALVHSLSCQISVSEIGPTLVPVDWCSLTSFLVPSTVLRELGYPREEFFLYWDDLDYTLRLRKAGYNLYLVKDSVVEHRAGAETAKEVTENTGLRRYYNYRNHIANIIIHRADLGKWVALAALVRITAGAAKRLCVSLLRNERESFAFVRHGVMDGYAVRLGKHS